jgi:hypothetical protein
MKVKALNIHIEDNQHEWIRRQAFERRISMADVVREAISKSMEGESEMKKARFRVPEKSKTALVEHDPSSQAFRAMSPYLELDLEDERTPLYLGTVYGIDGTPISVWHGTTRRYWLPNNVNAEELTTDINAGVFDELFQRIVGGSEVVWDGDNHVGRLNEDAKAAEEELEEELEGYADESIGLYEAGDWLQDSSDEDLGVTANSTDEELARIARRLEEEARAESAVVVGIEEHLRERIAE